MTVKVSDDCLVETIGACVTSLEIISAIGSDQKEYKDLETTLLAFTQKLADRLDG